jgi:hypothetical protein
MNTKYLLVVCLLGLLSSSLALQQSVNILKQIEEDPSDIAYSIYNTAKQIVSGELKSLNVFESSESETQATLVGVIPRKNSAPVPRAADSPVVVVDEASVSKITAAKISLLLPWIERGAQMLERTALKTGEKLPQLTLAILHPAQYTNVKFAVLDLEHSTLFVREEYIDQIDIEGVEEINEAYSEVFKLYDEYTKDKEQLTADELVSVTMKVVQEATPVMFRNIPACFTCMIVLGFALPIAWNFGLGYGFQYICVNVLHWNQDVCAQDSVMVAFAGLILMVPAAWLIVKVCVFWTGWCATKALLKF